MSLKEACKSLFARQFSYSEINKNGNLTQYTSRWVSKKKSAIRKMKQLSKLYLRLMLFHS